MGATKKKVKSMKTKANSYDSMEQLKKDIVNDPEIQRELNKIRAIGKKMQAETKN